MMMPNAPSLAVSELREILGLPAERPLGVRDVIAVPWTGTDAMPENPATPPAIALTLGDWPEQWRHSPGTAPQYLVTLRGLATPHRISGIWETDPAAWGPGPSGGPEHRTAVLVAGLAYVPSATLAGQLLDTGLMFGWMHPCEQFAFL